MKRILTTFITALLLVAALSVTASASEYDAVAEDLAAIGMFRGTANGFELDRAPTRSEAAIMLVRLYGAEDEAKAAYEAGELTHPFNDVSAFSSPYVAWVYSKGISNGTSATTFGSASHCTAKTYTAFLLRALGYQDGVDFAYADTLDFAASKGFLDTSAFSGTFLRDDLAALTYQALAADLKDGSTYLLDSLVQSGAIDAEAAKPMTEKFENYRALLGATSAMGSSIDTDFDMNMHMTATASGNAGGTPVSETEAMDVAAAGRVQMVMDEKDPQMALTMAISTGEEAMDIGMWLKDGWMYTSYDGEGVKQYIGDEMADFMAIYQELLEQSTTQMNVGMLPMISSVTAEKSGSSTVYTMTLNDALFGMVGDVMGMLTDAGSEIEGMEDLDLGLGMDGFTCTYTYTIDSKGQLKSAGVDMVMTMKMDMDLGEGGTMSTTIDMDMDMTMDVNATGKDVRITFPSFSGFEEISITG